MGKPLPTPYPGQSIQEYREQLVNFRKNYWSFLKPSKGGSKFIPLSPLTLIKKTKEMSAKKLSEHVEEELFDKDKRVTTPKIKKEIPSPPHPQEPKILKETEQPVKKKKPYYRKKYTKPTPVEVVIPEPVNKYLFIKGLLVGSVLTAIICHIIYSI
jgi:hypothetical protein